MSARRVTSSLEDYLEAILFLIETENRARVRDIADRLGVGKSAVTAALKNLAARKLIAYEPYRPISLTARGRRLAEDVTRRHDILKGFFVDVLGMAEGDAETNACRMEHAIGPKLTRRLAGLGEYIAAGSARQRKWITQFAEQFGRETS